MATVKKRRRNPRGVYAIAEKKVGGEFPYTTYTLRGITRLGQRIREQSTSKAELLGRKQALEIADANSPDERPVSSHLSAEQVREAEAAYQRLDGRSLSLAIDHFLKTYREPTTNKLLPEVRDLYVAEKERDLRSTSLSAMRSTLRAFCEAHATKSPHQISTFDVETFLSARRSVAESGKEGPVSAKTWNNLRGELHSFFEWCRRAPRKWVPENPVADIAKRKVKKTLPTIMPVRHCMELMRYAAAQKGGALVPYFALTLFAGIRPSVRDGEIVKLAARPDLNSLINLEQGVIRIPPEVAKGGTVRQIKIRKNLAAWLREYPIDKFPICPTNFQALVEGARAHLKLGKDVMRHTFISMHVACFKSIGEAALEAGNSESMVKVHYLNMVTEAEADLFWMISPDLVLPRSGSMEKSAKLWESAAAKVMDLRSSGVSDVSAFEVDALAKLMKSPFAPDPESGTGYFFEQAKRWAEEHGHHQLAGRLPATIGGSDTKVRK